MHIEQQAHYFTTSQFHRLQPLPFCHFRPKTATFGVLPNVKLTPRRNPCLNR
jgi:hypothetical protein